MNNLSLVPLDALAGRKVNGAAPIAALMQHRAKIDMSVVEILAVFGAPALLRKVAFPAGPGQSLTRREPTYYRVRALERRPLEARESHLSGRIWAGALQDRVWISTEGLPEGPDGVVIVPAPGDGVLLGDGEVIGYDGETEFFGRPREIQAVALLDPGECTPVVYWTVLLKPSAVRPRRRQEWRV